MLFPEAGLGMLGRALELGEAVMALADDDEERDEWAAMLRFGCVGAKGDAVVVLDNVSAALPAAMAQDVLPPVSPDSSSDDDDDDDDDAAVLTELIAANRKRVRRPSPWALSGAAPPPLPSSSSGAKQSAKRKRVGGPTPPPVPNSSSRPEGKAAVHPFFYKQEKVQVPPQIPPAAPFALRSWPPHIRKRSCAFHVPSAQLRRPGTHIVYWGALGGCAHATGNLALELCLFLSRTLHLPLLAIFTLPTGVQLAARAENARALHSSVLALAHLVRRLRAWRVPSLLFRTGEPAALLNAWAQHAGAHMVVIDELFSPAMGRLRAGLSRSLPCSVHCVDSVSAAPTAAALRFTPRAKVSSAASHTAWLLERLADPLQPSLPPSSADLPSEALQRSLFVRGARRAESVFVPEPLLQHERVNCSELEADSMRALGLPDPSAAPTEERASACLEDAVGRAPTLSFTPGECLDEAAGALTADLAPHLALRTLSPARVWSSLGRALAHHPQRDERLRAAALALFAERAYAEALCFHLEPKAWLTFDNLCMWVRADLLSHARDPRSYVYTEADLKAGRTHDRLWNATQAHVRRTGVLPAPLRGYYARRFVEWTPAPRDGVNMALQFVRTQCWDGHHNTALAAVAVAAFDLSIVNEPPRRPHAPVIGRLTPIRIEDLKQRVPALPEFMAGAAAPPPLPAV